MVGKPKCETMRDGRQSRRPSLEARMGSKDKGGKTTKKVGAKDLKEKRLDKKAKRAASVAKLNRV